MDLYLHHNIKYITAPYNKVELTRYQKGNYGWVITASSQDAGDLPQILTNLDNHLRQQFTTQPEET